MSQLIDELKADHVKLKQVLRKASDVALLSGERVDHLMTAKAALLAHLGKEDQDLYPPLRQAAERGAQLKHTLDFFAKDMERVTQQALGFFGKYSNAQALSSQLGTNIEFAVEFAKELEGLIIQLGLRIGREERILYPEYDRVAARLVA